MFLESSTETVRWSPLWAPSSFPSFTGYSSPNAIHQPHGYAFAICLALAILVSLQQKPNPRRSTLRA